MFDRTAALRDVALQCLRTYRDMDTVGVWSEWYTPIGAGRDEYADVLRSMLPAQSGIEVTNSDHPRRVRLNWILNKTEVLAGV